MPNKFMKLIMMNRNQLLILIIQGIIYKLQMQNRIKKILINKRKKLEKSFKKETLLGKCSILQ